VKPSGLELFHYPDGWTTVFVFPSSAEISMKDKQVEFEAHIGRIVCRNRFDLGDMMFQGKLEI
jgi:hypothetical protein